MSGSGQENEPESQIPPPEWDEPPVIFQGTLRRPDFRRQVPGTPDDVLGQRQVQVGVVLDTGSGMMRYEPYSPDEHPPLYDFPDRDMDGFVQGEQYDAAEAELTLSTTRKQGTSRAHPYDSDKAARKKGGDPDFTIPRTPDDAGSRTYWGPPDEEHPQIIK